MAYYRKNKRRFDPRYFMNERLEEEGLEEMQVGDGAGPDWQLETPGTVSKKLRDAFAKKDEEVYVLS